MKVLPDLAFSPHLLLRTPAYPYTLYTGGPKIPLADPYFRTAIQIASPVFYQQLKKKNFDAEKINPKERLTLLKYFNRMCFRPTPFGLFAGLTALNWSDNNEPVKLSANRKAHTLLSFEQSLHISKQVTDTFPEDAEMISANGSTYIVGPDYRHLKSENELQKGDRQYLINAVEKSPEISRILRFVQKPKSKKELISFVIQQFEVSEDESRDYINQLLAEQMLVSNLEPNISGQDHLLRISSLLNKKRATNELLSVILDYSKPLQYNLQALQNATVHPALKATEKSPFYVISERTATQNGLSIQLQEQIRDGIHCASRLNPVEKSAGLESFSKAFQQKYDQQWVRLMEALDPETGIAYQDLGANHQTPALLEGVDISNPSKKSHTIEWTPAHKLLLGKLANLKDGHNSTIQITDTDLAGIPESDTKPQLSPSFPVMFRLAGPQLYLEQAGGATATGLFGRFTPVNTTIKKQIKQTTTQEQALNKEVIFAEVVHIAEQHAANIDRRETLYTYEIPVMCTSALPKNKQIALSELWISVMDGEIILWSERLKKRIIPRFSSAYNPQRSNLAIFRFLCDLQHQGLCSQLSFELNNLFPDLNHYPRVEYKNTILSLQTWRLSKERTKIIDSLPEHQQLHALKTLIQELKLSEMISLNEYDHQLILKPNDPADQQTFLQIMQAGKDLMIKEFPFATAENHIIDQQKQPYSGQYMAAIHNQLPVYQTKLNHLPEPNTKTQRKFMPGSEWLYFKIYCHPYRSNSILTEYLLPTINNLGQRVKQYFFIRYSDRGYHIRLRLQIHPKQNTQIISQFKKAMEPLLKSALISDYSINTYERELERYDAEIIEQTERFFCAGSALAMDHLIPHTGQENELQYFQIAFSSVAAMCEAFELPLEKKEKLCRIHYNGLAKEFGLTDKTTEQLKQKYRKIKEAGLFQDHQINHYLTQAQYRYSFPPFQNSLTELNQAMAQWRLSKKISLLSSLIHMQLNRIFTEMPRVQEMVTYFCLSNYYYSKLQQEKKEKEKANQFTLV